MKNIYIPSIAAIITISLLPMSLIGEQLRALQIVCYDPSVSKAASPIFRITLTNDTLEGGCAYNTVSIEQTREMLDTYSQNLVRVSKETLPMIYDLSSVDRACKDQAISMSRLTKLAGQIVDSIKWNYSPDLSMLSIQASGKMGNSVAPENFRKLALSKSPLGSVLEINGQQPLRVTHCDATEVK